MDRGMEREDVAHTYNEISLSHKKEQIGSFVMLWMNLESVKQSEVNQKEKKISYINAYRQNLERWYK